MPDGSPRDALHRLGPARHAATLRVLGLAVRFEADEPALIDHARALYGAPGSEGGADPPADPALKVRLAVHDDHAGDEDHPEVRYRVPDGRRLLLSTPGSLAMADRDRGEAVCYVTPTLRAQDSHFRYAVLSALTLFLATREDRTPLHAAAVALGERGLLLHGPSGVGKSTLTWAAHAEGLEVVSEDVVFVQLRPRLRLWGLPGPVHVPPDALELLPGARPTGSTVRAGGVEKVVLPLSGPGAPGGAAPQPVGICLVVRSEGAPRLDPLPWSEVEAALGDPAEEGFDLARREVPDVLAALEGMAAWRLHRGSDPAAAARLLRAQLSSSRRGRQ